MAQRFSQPSIEFETAGEAFDPIGLPGHFLTALLVSVVASWGVYQ